MAAQLLEAGADPLLVDRHEHTCLHYAALFGWANCIAALLEGAVRLGVAPAPVWLKDVRVDAGGAARRAPREHKRGRSACAPRAAACPAAPWCARRCGAAARTMQRLQGALPLLLGSPMHASLRGHGGRPEHRCWPDRAAGRGRRATGQGGGRAWARLADRAPPSRRYVDARAAPGLTPLHLAAMHGRAAAVGALLAAGADLAARVGGGPPPARADSPLRWPPAPADATPVVHHG